MTPCPIATGPSNKSAPFFLVSPLSAREGRGKASPRPHEETTYLLRDASVGKLPFPQPPTRVGAEPAGQTPTTLSVGANNVGSAGGREASEPGVTAEITPCGGGSTGYGPRLRRPRRAEPPGRKRRDFTCRGRPRPAPPGARWSRKRRR